MFFFLFHILFYTFICTFYLFLYVCNRAALIKAMLLHAIHKLLPHQIFWQHKYVLQQGNWNFLEHYYGVHVTCIICDASCVSVIEIACFIFHNKMNTWLTRTGKDFNDSCQNKARRLGNRQTDKTKRRINRSMKKRQI